MGMRVECEPDAPGQFQPKRIWFGSRCVPVLSIVDRWYGADHSWWKVDTEDGLYVLRRDDRSGEWEVAAITSTN